MDEILLALTTGQPPEDVESTTTKELRRDVDFLKAAKLFKDIPARLAAYDSATGFYSWTWRDFGGLTNATRTNSANAGGGTPTINPARTPQGRSIPANFPVDCWLRPVGMDPTVGTIFEVVDGPVSRFSGALVGDNTVGSQTSIPAFSGGTILNLVAGTGYDTDGYLVGNTLKLPASGYYLASATVFLGTTTFPFQPTVYIQNQTTSAFLGGSSGYFGVPGTTYNVNISVVFQVTAADSIAIYCSNHLTTTAFASVDRFSVNRLSDL